MTVDAQLAARLYHGMKRIRMVEEGIAERYPAGQMRCPTHLSIGQEAAAVGVGCALKKDDLAVSTHRAHAHYLAKGGDMRAMLAEIYGKVTGCAKGRGGSMHLIDTSVGFVGSTAIVANSIPIAVGLGLALRHRGTPWISVSFFGEAATEEGVFYEAVNFAALHALPVLFVCENNLYSVYSHLRVRQPAARDICRVVEAMGISARRTDGNDAVAVYAEAARAVDLIRSGQGPRFIELTTYRWREHCGPNYDNHIGYRTEGEFAEWKQCDPISQLERRLVSEFGVPAREIDTLAASVDAEVASAFEFAAASEFPLSEEAFQGLYAGSTS